MSSADLACGAVVTGLAGTPHTLVRHRILYAPHVKYVSTRHPLRARPENNCYYLTHTGPGRRRVVVRRSNIARSQRTNVYLIRNIPARVLKCCPAPRARRVFSYTYILTYGRKNFKSRDAQRSKNDDKYVPAVIFYYYYYYCFLLGFTCGRHPTIVFFFFLHRVRARAHIRAPRRCTPQRSSLRVSGHTLCFITCVHSSRVYTSNVQRLNVMRVCVCVYARHDVPSTTIHVERGFAA